MASKPRISISTLLGAPFSQAYYTHYHTHRHSTSSLPSAGSVPIRAPLTMDGDSDSDDHSKGRSFSVSSESDYESEGFMTGEEFETASERPFVVDPAGENLNLVVENERSANLEQFLPVIERNMASVMRMSRVVPVARLSMEGDDDEEEEEGASEEEESVFYEPARVRVVPRIEVLERVNSAPRVKIEEDDSVVWEDAIAGYQSDAELSSSVKVVEDLSFDNLSRVANLFSNTEKDDSVIKDPFLGPDVVSLPGDGSYGVRDEIEIQQVAFVMDRETDPEKKLELSLGEGYYADERKSLENLEQDGMELNGRNSHEVEFDQKSNLVIANTKPTTQMNLMEVAEGPNEPTNQMDLMDAKGVNEVPSASLHVTNDSDITGSTFEECKGVEVEEAAKSLEDCSSVYETTDTVSYGLELDVAEEAELMRDVDNEVEKPACRFSSGSIDVDVADQGGADRNVEGQVDPETKLEVEFSEPFVSSITVSTSSVVEGSEITAPASTLVESNQTHECVNLEGGNLAETSEVCSPGGLLHGDSGCNEPLMMSFRSNQEVNADLLGRDKCEEEDGSCSQIISKLEPMSAVCIPEAKDSGIYTQREKKKIENICLLKEKFLRLIHRIGCSLEDSIVVKVLYRLLLAIGRHPIQNLISEAEKKMAPQLEAEVKDDIDFTLNILMLGKTGVGKSATINSIFGKERVVTNAFERSTTTVKVTVGTVRGIKIRVFDTPGLRSSVTEQAINRKILASLKKLTKRCPPDIMLYVDRLDTPVRDYNDLPLIRSITSTLGASIWRNTIIALTHAAATTPDGPSGLPLSYGELVAQQSNAVNQSIRHAIGDSKLMNTSMVHPVALVENHFLCEKNADGERVLPDGRSWRTQLLLLCCSLKTLSEASSVSKLQDLFDPRKLLGFGESLLLSNVDPKSSACQSGDNLDYAYRFPEPKSARPSLDLDCPDHDRGYEAIFYEGNSAVARKFPAGCALKVTKDKKEFKIRLRVFSSSGCGSQGRRIIC